MIYSCPYPYIGQRTIKISSLNPTLTYSKPRLFKLFPILPELRITGSVLATHTKIKNFTKQVN